VARVEIRGVSKRYPGVTALDDVELAVEPGEFFTLLGPSGCGKTTLLRTIAGFNKHDSGEILVDGTRIDNVPAHLRNIGMVYQDYAIFPHKCVADNVAFGLVTRGRPRAEVDDRVARALDLVQRGGLAARMPHELSGGQQQRVALARAMVINPQILLMDEPLSNLDAKLRLELRDDIRDLQRSLRITTIYVTHDQEEALVISDRICIMQGGRVHQVANPQEVYGRPATLFVASFVGSMNVFADVGVGPGGGVTIGSSARTLPALAGRSRVTLAVRPEDVVLSVTPPAAGDAMAIACTVEKVTYAGREAFYRLSGGGVPRILANVYRPEPAPLASVGDPLHAAFPLARLHAFDADSGQRVELRP
jgi:iron(III) transport system ATP-binding protein